MSLNKQIHAFSVCTDAFYNKDEEYVHNRLLRLYKLRKKDELPNWKKKSINRVIKSEKEKLSNLLDYHLTKNETRILNNSALIDKNIISLFESSLTRAIGLKTNELTKDLFIVNVFFFQVFEDLVKYGFYHNGEKYIFLTASAGQIRTKRAVFIRELVYNKISKRLMCGLSIEDINKSGGINTN